MNLDDQARELGLEIGQDIAFDRGGHVADLQEEIDHMLRYAEQRMEGGLDPDEQIPAQTVICGPGGPVPVIHPIDCDEAEDAVFGAFLPELISTSDAQVFTSLSEIWALPDGAPRPGEPGYTQPSDRPDRLEGLVVAGSDGVIVTTRVRRIRREEDGRGVWNDSAWSSATVPHDHAGGVRLVPLVRALRVVRLARAGRLLVYLRPQEWWTAGRIAAMQTMGHAIDEGGDTVKSQREIAKIRVRQLAEAQVALGVFVRDDDGLVPSPEVTAIADDPRLWEMELPPDDEFEGRFRW